MLTTDLLQSATHWVEIDQMPFVVSPTAIKDHTNNQHSDTLIHRLPTVVPAHFAEEDNDSLELSDTYSCLCTSCLCGRTIHETLLGVCEVSPPGERQWTKSCVTASGMVKRTKIDLEYLEIEESYHSGNCTASNRAVLIPGFPPIAPPLYDPILMLRVEKAAEEAIPITVFLTIANEGETYCWIESVHFETNND